MTSLSIMDTAFVWFESDDTPMHVTGLVLLRPPKRQLGQFARRLYGHMLSFPEVVAPFNWRLSVSYHNLPQWLPCERVVLADHIGLELLPEPGDRAQLMQLIGRFHSRPLDRSRPLWQLLLVDGMADGCVAVALKMHHALADGVRASGLFTRCMSTSARGPFRPFWQHPLSEDEGHQGDVSEQGMVAGWLDAVSKLSKEVLTLPGLLRLGSRLALKALHLGDSPLATPFTAPRTPLNQRTGGGRSICVGRFPLASFRQIGRLTGASLNDVALAVCDIALNRYLADHGWRPTKPLVALMPISLRRPGDLASACNKMSIGLVEMGAADDSPIERLAAIQRSSGGVKQEALSMSPAAYVNYSILVNAAALLGGKLNLHGVVPPASNLIISNVPGAKQPLYLMGARMTEVYPLSLLLPGQSLNITLYSYDGAVHFGLVGSNDALPHFEWMAEYLVEALSGLEQDVVALAVALVNGQLEPAASDDADDEDGAQPR